MALTGMVSDAAVLISCMLLMFLPAALSWVAHQRSKVRKAANKTPGVLSYLVHGIQHGVHDIYATEAKFLHEMHAAETRLLHGIQVRARHAAMRAA